jgi:DNA polymerase-3 subunit epsilon
VVILYIAEAMDFLAIDFETANELPTSACELGLAVVKYYKVVETRSWLIRPPDLRFNPFNTKLHGISADKVADQPDFRELWSELLPYFENDLVIAHNAGFDMDVLRRLLLHYGIPFNKMYFTCSIKVAKRVWTDHKRYGLKSLSRELGIELDHHHAVSDARACAMIASMAFHENQVSITSELETKLNIQPGMISEERFIATRNKSAVIKQRKEWWMYRN